MARVPRTQSSPTTRTATRTEQATTRTVTGQRQTMGEASEVSGKAYLLTTTPYTRLEDCFIWFVRRVRRVTQRSSSVRTSTACRVSFSDMCTPMCLFLFSLRYHMTAAAAAAAKAGRPYSGHLSIHSLYEGRDSGRPPLSGGRPPQAPKYGPGVGSTCGSFSVCFSWASGYIRNSARFLAFFQVCTRAF